MRKTTKNTSFKEYRDMCKHQKEDLCSFNYLPCYMAVDYGCRRMERWRRIHKGN